MSISDCIFIYQIILNLHIIYINWIDVTWLAPVDMEDLDSILYDAS
jgi:hypothetical protein